MEPGCTPHMGAHIGPIWVPYRLLAGEIPHSSLTGGTVLCPLVSHFNLC